MTTLEHRAEGPVRPPERIPFPVVDEIARHCLQEEEPETVHIEVHLPGHLDRDRLRSAFHEALRRHPRILMREAAGRWYRRRYEWELTADPDVEVVTFLPPGPDALRGARTRALVEAPPLTASPPIRLEVVEGAGAVEGSEATDAVGEAAAAASAAAAGSGAGPAGASSRAGQGDAHPSSGADATAADAGAPAAATPAAAAATASAAAAGSRAAGAARVGAAAPGQRRQATPTPGTSNAGHSKGTVLFLTINHTALDGPACLRVLATAAELYSGRDNSPAASPTRPTQPPPHPEETPSNWSPPARVAPGTPEPSPGNGMLVTELPLPPRPKGSPYTVNDQLMVTTALMITHWNREHGEHPRPLRITMPVDDRPRDTTMPIGNGTRLVEVPFTPAELNPADMPALLSRTALRTRALKSLPRPQLGHGATLLTAPITPVSWRAALTRTLRRAAAPWTSTTLLSNIGRVPYPLDFGEEAGRAHAVWFSAPARMPRGLTVTTASTAGRLHLALRWSRALLSHGDGAHLRDLFEHYLHTTEVAP
ncbi:condensation protein [Streptomyces sp. GESEQ-4]|uniref:condensation protein n=1 Tax=Streptomyces sp. GESEQ-4 TaxID=2812655 RepID=UPI001FF08DD0|nr:condensation protein [Streptomyces sp. GESEQ-4]